MASKHLFRSKIAINEQQPSDTPGSVRTEYDSSATAYKTYRYVQNGSIALTAGVPVSFEDLYGKSVTSDASAGNLGNPAGVARGAVTAKYYGWIQTGGYIDSVNIGSGGVVGEQLILTSTNATAGTIAAAGALTYPPLGMIVTAGVISGSCGVYLILDSVVQ